ncbi:hypothetical protein [Thalassotalea sp. Y01]|uniref:hypothetical protein n=1 Tax=Thalassotalea sp. Y01 TaxID=2729613 RepID=UPI00145C89D0|nr:hypothetical protein [Thalassotalea sp. Y01]NMP16010.1 hypothetical protein [Thalassotalea sp. Y01]
MLNYNLQKNNNLNLKGIILENYYKKALCVLPIFIIAHSPIALADKNASADEAAKELANPNTAFASLAFKNQYKSFEDDTELTQTLFQPVLPFILSGGDKIIFRPALPIIYDSRGEESGLGDLSYDLVYAFGDVTPGTLLAVGIVGTLPSGDSEVGGGEITGFGPSIFYGKLDKTGLLGAYTSHIQSTDEGDLGEAGKLSVTSSQLMWVNFASGGWTWGSTPKVEYNHEADEQEWTIPLNINISKTTILNSRPWKFGFEFDYYIEKDEDFGPEFMVTFSITPVVENVLNTWLNN